MAIKKSDLYSSLWACDIGLGYKLDAIYYVAKDSLSVRFWDSRRKRIEIGRFSPRLHTEAIPVVHVGYSQLRVEAAQLKTAIHGQPQFAAFIAELETHFKKWRATAFASLRQLKLGCLPKEVIRDYAEAILIARGGLTVLGNLQSLCAPCNLKKGKRLESES